MCQTQDNPPSDLLILVRDIFFDISKRSPVKNLTSAIHTSAHDCFKMFETRQTELMAKLIFCSVEGKPFQHFEHFNFKNYFFLHMKYRHTIS